MQELAHEMNFSESTFVMPPESSGARRVRIFTPRHEMPMAGHPTVGTTWVLASRGEIALDSASVDATVLLGIGPVTVTIESIGGRPDFVWMVHRAAEFGVRRRDRGRIAKALGIAAADIRDDLPIQIVSTGFPFMLVPVRTLDALAKCAPNATALAALFKPAEPVLAVYMFVANESGEFAPRSRMFAPHDGVPEDPATGSASAPFGAYAARYGLIDPVPTASFLVRQGVEMGRPSEIRVEVVRQDRGAFAIRIGGRCAIVGEGSMFL
jgi:trans-2,3-dihydro-3-hydroxyanthranilate isomerase